jgi:cellobiose phosphorylase
MVDYGGLSTSSTGWMIHDTSMSILGLKLPFYEIRLNPLASVLKSTKIQVNLNFCSSISMTVHKDRVNSIQIHSDPVSKNPLKSDLHDLAVCQNLVPLVNIKIAGKWMFIPLKMYL